MTDLPVFVQTPQRKQASATKLAGHSPTLFSAVRSGVPFRSALEATLIDPLAFHAVVCCIWTAEKTANSTADCFCTPFRVCHGFLQVHNTGLMQLKASNRSIIGVHRFHHNLVQRHIACQRCSHFLGVEISCPADHSSQRSTHIDVTKHIAIYYSKSGEEAIPRL